MSQEQTEEQISLLLERLRRLRGEIGKVIVGQQDAVEGLLVAMLAGGHCLLKGVPGLGKTLMVRTLARAVDVAFRRVQFTPDLMPSDIVGTEVLEEDHATGKRFFKFMEGPVFTQILLADEINRTPPKTQAALLEAMQEHSVTYAGETRKLPSPFFVLATQNPIEQAGTYPLPEAQLDRFLLSISLDYPDEVEELRILTETTGQNRPEVVKVIDASEIMMAQNLVREVHISPELLGYTNKLIRATRPATSDIAAICDAVSWGAGPRAGQAVILTAKARALLDGRFALTREDIAKVIYPVLRHRLILNFKAEAERISPDDLTRAILQHVPEPESPLTRV